MVALVAPHGALATAPSAQGTLMVVRFVQFWKALDAILVGVPRNVKEVRPVQRENA